MIFVILTIVSNGCATTDYNYACGAADDDISCSLAGAIDPDGNAEITVVDIGNDTSGSDQFACLVNGGTGSLNPNEYDSIDGALDDLEHLEEEICEELATRICMINLSDKFYHS